MSDHSVNGLDHLIMLNEKLYSWLMLDCVYDYKASITFMNVYPFSISLHFNTMYGVVY